MSQAEKPHFKEDYREMGGSCILGTYHILPAIRLLACALANIPDLDSTIVLPNYHTQDHTKGGTIVGEAIPCRWKSHLGDLVGIHSQNHDREPRRRGRPCRVIDEQARRFLSLTRY